MKGGLGGPKNTPEQNKMGDGKYNREEVFQVMSEIEEIIRHPPGHSKISNFLGKHPWAQRFISDESPEANKLRGMAENESFRIISRKLTRQEAILRETYRSPHQLSFQTEGGGKEVEFIFRFEKTDDGRYIPISG